MDAIFLAIQKATETECELRQYTVEAVTEGEDALGQVTVMLRAAGRLATGQGVATDILEASARAYVRALSNALDGAAIREAEAATAEAASSAPRGPSRMPRLARRPPRCDHAAPPRGSGRRPRSPSPHEGASVALGARRKDRLEDLAGRIEGDGGTAVALEVDVGSEEQARGVHRGRRRGASAASTSSSTTPG